ncbi:hypothetical protein Vretimale_5279 [Volvox reticuliferus]|uniref:Uncharacterized protein n=1 Tax=Volvox reticuliferus TaxID=1737510 RepID=A0A8J4LK38_9CHLO|nr:hypothetical protein Vretifemale_3631 [Volvox reticuliferus]GIM00471.1 hypothetical protein Vretimale_5279 [Volvox reticuliferus]
MFAVSNHQRLRTLRLRDNLDRERRTSILRFISAYLCGMSSQLAAVLQSGNIWFRVAAISGATAVGLGAYGAHGFRPKDPYYTEVFRRANNLHMMHSLLLAIAPSTKRPWLLGGLTLAGITLFSGTCYNIALKEDKKWAHLAPIGGMALIAAWLSLAL